MNALGARLGRWRWALLAVVLLTVAVVAVAQANGGYSLGWWTVDGGGGASVGGSYALAGGFGPGAGPAPTPTIPATGERYFQSMYRLGAGPQGLTIRGQAGWYEVGTEVITEAAPGTLILGGVTYTFAGWYLDGVYRGDNPIAVTVSDNHIAVALYLPD